MERNNRFQGHGAGGQGGFAARGFHPGFGARNQQGGRGRFCGRGRFGAAGLVVVAMLKAKEEDGTTMLVQGLVMELKVEIVLIIIGTLVLALMLDQMVVI